MRILGLLRTALPFRSCLDRKLKTLQISRNKEAFLLCYEHKVNTLR